MVEDASPTPSRERTAEPELREQLASLQGLLALSMLMMESASEQEILRLAATTVPSLGACELVGVNLTDDGWRATSARWASTRRGLDPQLAALHGEGGLVAVATAGWGWAYPLQTVGVHFGYLVVAAGSEPSAAVTFRLGVLARQTGTALAGFRLNDRERATAMRLQATNAELGRTVDELQRSHAIHDRLTRVAVAGEGLDGIARALHDLTSFPIAVEDPFGNLLSWAGPERPDPYPKPEGRRREELVNRARSEGRPVRDGERLVALAATDHDVLGLLAMVDPTLQASWQDLIALEHAATVMAMEMARLRSVLATELRLTRDLVDELLSDSQDEARTLAHARALGYDVDRPHRVVVVAPGVPTADQGEVFFHAVRRAARDLRVGSLLAARRGAVVLLATRDDLWEALRVEVARSPVGEGCRLGVGGPCRVPSEFPRSHREAQLALRVGQAARVSGATFVYDDLGVYGLLATMADVSDIERFVEQWLGRLIAYDDRRGAALVHTVEAYLESGRSVDAASKSLEVHRNTVKYRLQRIADISGLDLTDADTVFNIQLAGRAWRILEVIRAGAASPAPQLPG